MSDNHNEYEDICFICRRPESKAGRMFHLPGNICICDDCMHTTMDSMNQMDQQGMFNNPYMNPFMMGGNPMPGMSPEKTPKKNTEESVEADAEETAKEELADDNEAENTEKKENSDEDKDDGERVDFGRNMNGRGFFPNISFVNLSDLQGEGIPFRQKIKKKKKSKKSAPVLDIKDIPAPHKIKA